MGFDIKNAVATAALLHDIGKLLRRSGEGGTHHYNSYQFVRNLLTTAGTHIYSKEEIDFISKLALYHHNNKDDYIDFENGRNNIYLKIIQGADSDSASERKEYTGEGEGSVEGNPLTSIISAINSAFFDDIVLEELLVYYPEEYHLNFPQKNEGTYITQQKAKDMLAKFETEVTAALKKSKTKEQFINSLNFLLKKYTSFITSSGKEEIRDISLYHHSSTTAAFAVCRLLDYETFGNRKEQTYILLLAKIFNIQNYIFDNINKNIERPLKRVFIRSSLVSIINTIIPYQIVKELGLYSFNILYSGGGTFSIILPQVYKDKAEEVLEQVKKSIAEMFENKIYLEYVLKDLKIKDEGTYSFEEYFKEASEELQNKKYRRSLEGLILDLESKYFICKNCGINTKGNGYCNICAIEDKWMEIDPEKVKLNYSGMDIKNIQNPAEMMKGKEGDLYIFFDYDSYKISDVVALDVKQNGRREILKTKNICENCTYKDTCDIKNTEGTVSLNCLAGISENDALLATAKIDVDDMEYLLYYVYPIEKFGEKYPFSVSRLSYLSDSVDLFFSVYLKKLIETKYKDTVMILYSGGDDIVLTGIWEKVLEAVVEIEKNFGRYVSASSKREVTISSAVTFHRPRTTFSLILNKLEKNMEKAKEYKDCVTVDGYTLTYQNLNTALKISEEIKELVENMKISRKLLFDMLNLILTSRLKKKGAITVAKRAALFNYYMERNIEANKNLNSEEKNKIRSIFYNLVVNSGTLDLSQFTIELAIRKTKMRSE
ncbi:CRISPR-associated protein Csm1 [Thermoanaerobacter thermohydrosulfuricus]|uniref:CRISPR-associated protein Csm1 n=1 Tax=Thermoanaerobacter thermohydrosulfuricus TaxID=1516 RepID=A0A1G7HLV9_THETY|nr:type III-A CRISPR-associated protein Cas10/Csm1 [Thermoanaerobacter thermohydrosulfuricus]SDF01452.1 CRISPR-associated protein Csm1 [Thermoanaerobacter thermohydrosulfuricus]